MFRRICCKTTEEEDFNVYETMRKSREQYLKEKETWLKHLTDFKRELRYKNLSPKKTRHDGNCMFRAICDQIEGNMENHMYYRALACKYLKANPQLILEEDKTELHK